MLGFSGFPRQVIIPAAARLARVLAETAKEGHQGADTKGQVILAEGVNG
jgi:hypothetical protein